MSVPFPTQANAGCPKNKTFQLSPEQRHAITQWALTLPQSVFDGDEWHMVEGVDVNLWIDEDTDLNTVTAYPLTMDTNGFFETDTSEGIRVASFPARTGGAQ